MRGLNEKQREAVEHKDGPLLVVAGAGTGKTRVITHRIAHLIAGGVKPSEILAVTFTNKASQEMKDRVTKLLNNELGIRNDDHNSQFTTHNSLPFVDTFHSLGVHILRESGQALGISRWFTIHDRDDSVSLVRRCLKDEGYDPKQFAPAAVLSVISKSKGNLLTRADFASDASHSYFAEAVARVWRRYEEELAKQKALDFDDLLLKTVELLRDYQDVRKRYQTQWRYIHVDEYQDTNKVQYEMIRLLAGEHRNICVVGDSDKCFPEGTLIDTPSGQSLIEKLRAGDTIITAAGRGKVCEGIITKIHRKNYSGKLLVLNLENGKKIQLTKDHIVFGRLPEHSMSVYVYLMYRKDRGYRVGIAKGSRSSGHDGQEKHGLVVRGNQEHADRIWILRVCKNRLEAIYWEQFYAFRYGIPMTLFHNIGRRIALSDKLIAKIFLALDTSRGARQLMADEGLYFEYPHYLPQGTTPRNTKRQRTKLRLTLFSDNRRTKQSPWGASRLSINTSSSELKSKLLLGGFMSRKGKNKDWRLEISNLDYAQIEKVGEQISLLAPSLEIERAALLTEKGSFRQLPASSLRNGMEVAVRKGADVTKLKIKSIKSSDYSGKVFDLDVSKVHNYIANSLVVHNCIYTWRGATIENILGFEEDFPGAKVVILEENYRSTSNILDAANAVIAKNEGRKDKNLFTSIGTGEKITVYEAFDPSDEAHFVTRTVSKLHSGSTAVEKGGFKYEEIAVLYRANFQSRALEEAFLEAGIPYTVLGTRFFERAEIKDILAYVKAALNQSDKASFARAVSTPRRGIGEKSLENYFVTNEKSEKISSFLNLLSDFENKLKTLQLPEALRYITIHSGYEAMLKQSEEQERLENIQELVNLSSKYKSLPNDEALEKFLTDAGLASDQDTLILEEAKSRQEAGSPGRSKERLRGVRLMTVHAAKGLEFEHVFIVGLEQDLFPHRPMDDPPAGGERMLNEEERRLFYVALTRAKKQLYLSWCQTRQMYGETRVQIQSEYLGDLPNELIESAEVLPNIDYSKGSPRVKSSGYLPDIIDL